MYNRAFNFHKHENPRQYFFISYVHFLILNHAYMWFSQILNIFMTYMYMDQCSLVVSLWSDYMDSHAECGKTFELGMNPATVYGKGAVQTSEGPLSCTIILSTDGIREHRRFTIELVTGFITSQGINFYIYDGQWTQDSGAQTLVTNNYICCNIMVPPNV